MGANVSPQWPPETDRQGEFATSHCLVERVSWSTDLLATKTPAPCASSISGLPSMLPADNAGGEEPACRDTLGKISEGGPT